MKGDLFPDEGIWLWKVEVPSLTAIRSLSTGMVLGCQVEKHMNWYLHPEHVSILLVRLMPQLDRLACVIDNFATSVCRGFQFLFCFSLSVKQLSTVNTCVDNCVTGPYGDTRYASYLHCPYCL